MKGASEGKKISRYYSTQELGRYQETEQNFRPTWVGSPFSLMPERLDVFAKQGFAPPYFEGLVLANQIEEPM